jgi:hypothetical protein
MTRSSAILAVGAVVAALVVAPVASADASPALRAADSATASGRHFYTLREADVIAGSPSAYLVIAYAAGRALSDGTIRIVLPGDHWRTPLSARTLVTEIDEGTVAVRPWTDSLLVLPEPGVDPAIACPLAGTPVPWMVETVLGSQVIVVRHVDCAAGKKLFVHIKGVAAPSRVGRYHIPVVASDRSGPPRLSVATVGRRAHTTHRVARDDAAHGADRARGPRRGQGGQTGRQHGDRLHRRGGPRQ